MSVVAIFFFHGGIQRHTSASYEHPCQEPFCQTAILLPSVTQQQHAMECWWEGSVTTAIPPISAPNAMGQHHKIGGITFGAALINSTISIAMK